MAKEICISSTPHETRLAILEDDQLAEIYYERENEYTLAGSIYNGRVTRVLPGMQSAFVDLGLERDAFLYVTDFIELEDQEDTDELEKAAAGGQAPREVRHPHGVDRNGAGAPDDAQRAPTSPAGLKGGRQEERGQRYGQGRREARHENQPSAEAETEAAGSIVPESPAAGQAEGAGESSEPGARRWRGRRRRRGGRGFGGQPIAPAEAEAEREGEAEAPMAREQAPALATPEVPAAPRGHKAPAPFVLPGESLSKYGGTTSESAKTEPEPSAPPRASYSSRPSTLIEAPLAWDGSGLLPGESLSVHRRHADSQTERVEEAQEQISAAPATELAPEETVEFEEIEAPAPKGTETESPEESTFEFEEDELEPDAAQPLSEEEFPALETAEEEGRGIWDHGSGHGAPVSDTTDETTSGPEQDADASHRVDPSAPSGFKLFGFGKKKKDEEAAGKTTAAAPVSTYAPGNGIVEEEVIEGEEFEAAPHARRHKPEVHDLDDYEEQTLPSHMRTGDLGEMLQEAHLDHRIQMNFDEKNVEEAEAEEEEEAPAGAQPAPGRERRERGGRGQGGRGAQGHRRGPSRRSAQTSDLPIISDLLKSGQEILVQIAKEPIAKKGARITSHIALPGRFLVFMPTVTHVGVSRKIASDEERHRLKRILTSERGNASGGFIVRTAADGASEDELRADLRFLMNLWNEIKQRSESSKSPALIYHDLSLIERILRDQVSADFANIWVDTEGDYERIVRFLNRFSPSLVRRVKLYTKETPLFEHFGIQDEISKALRSKVWLKSGGSIVINQTEALVAIDINTGKYVGKSARLEDTILKTNLDAVPEIVRQIRLRDLGGIIVIDFIDMDERKNRFKVMAALEEALKSDRAPTKVLQFNDFGLVAITRKRVKQSLERTLSVPCPTCQATGMVKSPTTVCNEIYIEMRKMKKHFENADVMLRVNPETVKVLKSNGNRWLTDFEELVGKNVLVKSDPTLHPEQFDIQG
ncbi:MAG: Rne/Rng family ribonuclease [Terracidiphilus sp.]|jgi:ribonuclease G